MKELRLAGIDSIPGANHFLEMRFLPEWEQRFTVAARNPRNVHRRLGHEQHLQEILSVRVARKVAQDHTVSWDGNRWGLVRGEVCAGLRGAAVEIERRLDGSHWLRYRGRYLHLRACPEPVRISAGPSGLRPPGLAEQKARPKTESKPKYHVPAEHPWRRPWNRTFLLCVDSAEVLFLRKFAPKSSQFMKQIAGTDWAAELLWSARTLVAPGLTFDGFTNNERILLFYY